MVGIASYADQGRAKVDACNAGLIRIYADRETAAVTGPFSWDPQWITSRICSPGRSNAAKQRVRC
jgi:hypothetical protein